MKIQRRHLLATFFLYLAVSTIYKPSLNFAFAADANPKNALLVAAAISLKEPLEQIQKELERQKKSLTLQFSFAASGALQKQIEAGAPIDVFLSAAQKHISELQQKKLTLPEKAQVVAKNQLVLILSKSIKDFKEIKNLTQPNIKKIALGEPESVPAGRYALQTLKSLNLDELLKEKFVFGNNVRQVLSYVETGVVDAGFVYATDARLNNQVVIAQQIPEKYHETIVYPGVVLKNSKQPKQAQEFLNFLLTPESQKIFNDFGFISPQ